MRKKSKRKPAIYLALGIFLLISLPWFLGIINARKTETTCANSISCIKDLSGVFDGTKTEGEFMGTKVSVPSLLAEVPASVLGETSGEKVIKIDLTNQRLSAFEGDRKVYEFLVSTGKWGQTPTGTFRTWVKLRSTLMSGGNRSIGTYYYLPNVQYTMFFANDEVPKTRGFAVHGTYWHNNFGYPMSHGCVNLRNEDAALLFSWAEPPATGHTTYVTKDNPGTKIVIYGVTPNE